MKHLKNTLTFTACLFSFYLISNDAMASLQKIYFPLTSYGGTQTSRCTGSADSHSDGSFTVSNLSLNSTQISAINLAIRADRTARIIWSASTTMGIYGDGRAWSREEVTFTQGGTEVYSAAHYYEANTSADHHSWVDSVDLSGTVGSRLQLINNSTWSTECTSAGSAYSSVIGGYQGYIEYDDGR